MEKLSVIVPVYNVEKYLERCIESILGQTYSNLEVILVDDGSTDHSGQLCDKWKNKDSRIKVIHQKNMGLSAARNAGIKIATAEYIAFVDSDDFVHPRMYELLYKAISQSKADISICRELAFDENIEPPLEELSDSVRMIQENREAFLKHYLDEFSGPLTWAWNKLYRRQLIEGVCFPVGKYMEDIAFMAQIAARVKQAVWVDARLYYYRQRSGSIMNSGKEGLLIDYGEALVFEYRHLTDCLDEKCREALLVKCLTRLADLEGQAYRCKHRKAKKILREHYLALYRKEFTKITGARECLKLALVRYVPFLYRILKAGVRQ